MSRFRYSQNSSDELLQTHLQNIQSLSTIIRDSQRLIENAQTANTRTRRSGNRTNESNVPDIFTAFLRTEGEHLDMPELRRSSGIPRTTTLRPQSVNNDINSLFYFTFDNLNPSTIPTTTTAAPNNTNPRVRDVSLQTLFINESNADVVNNTTSTTEYDNFHLYDISEYRLITEPLNDICPITRDRFYSNQNISMIKRCKHLFNKTALNMWLERNNSCPYCRCSVT